MLTFTENRRRSTGLTVSTNPRTVLRSTGLAEATQAEAIAGTIQHRYISPLRLQQKLDNDGFLDTAGVERGAVAARVRAARAVHHIFERPEWERLSLVEEFGNPSSGEEPDLTD